MNSLLALGEPLAKLLSVHPGSTSAETYVPGVLLFWGLAFSLETSAQASEQGHRFGVGGESTTREAVARSAFVWETCRNGRQTSAFFPMSHRARHDPRRVGPLI